MIYFKACERCGGDIRESGDMYGPYVQCIQCGHMVDLPDPRLVAAGRDAPRKGSDAAA